MYSSLGVRIGAEEDAGESAVDELAWMDRRVQRGFQGGGESCEVFCGKLASVRTKAYGLEATQCWLEGLRRGENVGANTGKACFCCPRGWLCEGSRTRKVIPRVTGLFDRLYSLHWKHARSVAQLKPGFTDSCRMAKGVEVARAYLGGLHIQSTKLSQRAPSPIRWTL